MTCDPSGSILWVTEFPITHPRFQTKASTAASSLGKSTIGGKKVARLLAVALSRDPAGVKEVRHRPMDCLACHAERDGDLGPRDPVHLTNDGQDECFEMSNFGRRPHRSQAAGAGIHRQAASERWAASTLACRRRCALARTRRPRPHGVGRPGIAARLRIVGRCTARTACSDCSRSPVRRP